MLASVIIPTHHRHEPVLQLLDSLVLQDLPPEDFEVLVVSNLMDGRLQRKILHQVSHRLPVQFFEVGRLGVNRARNRGIEHAKGKYLFFLDDDCFLHRTDHLKKGIELIQRWPEVSAIGGPYILGAESNTMEQVYNSICRQWLENSVRRSGYTVNLVGGNMVFRQSVFSSGLRFNEDIIFGGAETELNSRLIQLGSRLRFDPNLTVEHRLHLNLKGFFTKAFWQGFGASRREMAGLSTEMTPSSILKACAYPTKLTELCLVFYDHSFQMGWNWALQKPTQRPTTYDIARLFVTVLKKDFTLNKYKDWLRLKPHH